MRINGLALLVERGVARVDQPRATRYQRAIVLGAPREDVSWIPGLGAIEHLSLGHFDRPGRPGGFWSLGPGARWYAERHVVAAVRAHRRGKTARGFVRLGHAAHLLADIAGPVHVHGHLHDTDGSEWYVAAHRDELAALPVPGRSLAVSPAALVESLARFTGDVPADATRSPPGRLLRRLGLVRPVGMDVIERAARAIVPVAAALMAAWVGLGLHRIGERPRA